MIPSRGGAPLGDRVHPAAGTPGPNEHGSSSSSVTVRALGRRSTGGSWPSSGMNSRSRWRQPPHGTHDVVAVGDHRGLERPACARRRPARRSRTPRRTDPAGRRRSRRSRRRGSSRPRRAARRRRGSASTARAPCAITSRRRGDQRVGAEQAVRVGVGEDPLRRSAAPRAGARPSRARPQVGVGGRHALELDERAEALRRVSRWIRTPSHSSRRRSLSTTTSVPSAASSDGAQRLGVVDRR